MALYHDAAMADRNCLKSAQTRQGRRGFSSRPQDAYIAMLGTADLKEREHQGVTVAGIDLHEHRCLGLRGW
jgi:hypothetical protein